LFVGVAILKLRVAENLEVMVDRRLVNRRPRQRLRLRRSGAFLFRIIGGLLRVVHLRLQFLDLLLVLLVQLLHQEIRLRQALNLSFSFCTISLTALKSAALTWAVACDGRASASAPRVTASPKRQRRGG